MKVKKQIITMLVLLLCLCSACPLFAADLVKVPTAWMPELETFPIWYAKQQGWDKAAGMDLQLYSFDSGPDILRAFPARGWIFGGIGAVPAMVGAARYNLSIIGLANDEAKSNAIMVRENSPFLKTKGYNKKYPEMYGDPDSVRGKTIFCTRVTSADYTLSLWLKALGLKDSDIVFQNLDQAPALAAFDSGLGDAVVLWAPFTFVGENRGWKTVSTPEITGKHLPIVLVANSAYATQYPNLAATFLALYTRGVKWFNTAPKDEVIKELRRFYLEWAGQDYSLDMLKRHPTMSTFFDLETQKKLFSTTTGVSAVQQWMNDLTDFYYSVGMLTKQDRKVLQGSPYVTGKYLERVVAEQLLPK